MALFGKASEDLKTFTRALSRKVTNSQCDFIREKRSSKTLKHYVSENAPIELVMRFGGKARQALEAGEITLKPWERGRVFDAIEEPQTAEAAYQEAIDSGDSRGYASLAGLLLRYLPNESYPGGDKRVARQAVIKITVAEIVPLLEEAIARGVNSHDLYYVMGSALLKLKRNKEASQYFLKAQEVTPDGERKLFYMALHHLAAGEDWKAVGMHYLEEAKKSGSLHAHLLAIELLIKGTMPNMFMLNKPIAITVYENLTGAVQCGYMYGLIKMAQIVELTGMNGQPNKRQFLQLAQSLGIPDAEKALAMLDQDQDKK